MTKSELTLEISKLLSEFKAYDCISLFSVIVNEKLSINASRITKSGLMRLKKDDLQFLYDQAKIHEESVLPAFINSFKGKVEYISWACCNDNFTDRYGAFVFNTIYEYGIYLKGYNLVSRLYDLSAKELSCLYNEILKRYKSFRHTELRMRMVAFVEDLLSAVHSCPSINDLELLYTMYSIHENILRHFPGIHTKVLSIMHKLDLKYDMKWRF